MEAANGAANLPSLKRQLQTMLVKDIEEYDSKHKPHQGTYHKSTADTDTDMAKAPGMFSKRPQPVYQKMTANGALGQKLYTTSVRQTLKILDRNDLKR